MILAYILDDTGAVYSFENEEMPKIFFPNLITSVFSELHMTAQFMMFTSKRFYDQITYTCERMNI